MRRIQKQNGHVRENLVGDLLRCSVKRNRLPGTDFIGSQRSAFKPNLSNYLSRKGILLEITSKIRVGGQGACKAHKMFHVKHHRFLNT